MSAYGERIRVLRERINYSQMKFAHIFDLGQSSVGMLLRADKKVLQNKLREPTELALKSSEEEKQLSSPVRRKICEVTEWESLNVPVGLPFGAVMIITKRRRL